MLFLGARLGKGRAFLPALWDRLSRPPESRIGTCPERLFLKERLSHGTSVGSGLDTKDTVPSLLILFQPAEGMGTKS